MSIRIVRSLLIGVAILSCLSVAFGQPAPAPRLRPIQQDGKWGYIDNTGKVVIKPQFSWAEEFFEGLAAFENEDGKHGYIDETGRVVIEPKFDNWTRFSEGLAAVSIDFEWGYIDKTGQWVIKPQFSLGRPFSDGLALVGLPLSGKPTFPPGPVKHVFIDKTGQVVINAKDDILNGRFSEGFGAVQFISNKGIDWVLIDKAGKILITGQEFRREGFSGGLAAIKKDGKWGYADQSGRFVIEPQFEEANSFSEGLAAVNVGGKWGYIDNKGKIAIKPGFKFEPDAFSEGLALVSLKDQCGYIDKLGKVVIKLKCEEAEEFKGGLASIRVGAGPAEKRGYVNQQGKYVWGPTLFKYKSLEEINARARKEAKEEEVLTPLTDEERSLDPRDIVLQQPDFVADLSFFRHETVSGGGGAERIARKGNRYRKESQFWVFVGELGKPRVRLFPEAKAYDDLEGTEDQSATGFSPFDPRTLALEPDTSFKSLGTVIIDGHRCIKIQVARKGKPEEIFLYAAPDLKNLVIAAQISDPPRGYVQRLSNISLEVPGSLVEIPSDYKPVEHDRWTKIETARVNYKGRPSKDFGVFRAPGGQLFVWINDAPYPWHYLVRPSEGTVETAFQGLLVTRAGEWVWQTKESEAFSLTHYRKPRKPPDYENAEDKKVIVKSNSVKFRSNDYEKDKGIIEVSW